MSNSNRESDFITLARQYTRNLVDAKNNLLALQKEWNAENYGQTLTDGIGQNAGITALQVGSVVVDTVNAIETLLQQGYATNLDNLL